MRSPTRADWGGRIVTNKAWPCTHSFDCIAKQLCRNCHKSIRPAVPHLYEHQDGSHECKKETTNDA